MIQSEEDKRLVDQYKLTNIALRKQLVNLNNQIDKILTKKTNKVGLQKLPSVTKKLTDPNVIQQEVQNLRKRQELLQKDAENYKAKASVNYYQKIREVETLIQEREQEMEDSKKTIKEMERKDKIFNAQAAKDDGPNSKWEKRIATLQEEISRFQKVQSELVKEINYQAVSETKNLHYRQELAEKHKEVLKQKQKQIRNKSPPLLSPAPITNKKSGTKISQEQWKELKKQFLIFKESKQNQQWALNDQNERLRGQVQEWQRKIKAKKKRIDTIMQNEEKNKHRQARVYSTLQQQKPSKGIRYRDRNNSIQYNTKN